MLFRSEEISYRREDQEMRTLCSRPFAVASFAIGALTLSALQTQAAEQTQGADLTQTNLVSNIPALKAKITDPQLVNPWGVSHSPTSPFWTSNQGKNTARSTTSLTRRPSLRSPSTERALSPSLARRRRCRVQQHRDKDRLAKSTTPTHPRSRSQVETANSRTSSSPI